MKKKYKIVERDGVIIYIDKEPEIGYEAGLALVLLTESLVGAKSFAMHLKDPMEFWVQFRNEAEEYISETERIITDLAKEWVH